MTSAERHERRYQRRKWRRERKTRGIIDGYDDFNRAACASSLIKAHFDSRRGVMWKYAPALYDRRLIRNAQRSAGRLQAGQDTRQGFHHFPVIERGKERDVHSLHYTERVVRRSFCINCLVPLLSHNLIHDNGACLEGKGGSFTEDRLTHHLHDYYKTYGDNEGYVITVDFSKYFSNIDHSKLFGLVFDRYIRDLRLNRTAKAFVQAGDRESGTPGRGLFIGPEDSQIFAVSYPNGIDHTIKDAWGVRWYGRYNDDSYIIVRDKATARQILSRLLELYDAYGIIPNRRKTQLHKLSRGFTFMKIKWALQPTGRVVRRISRDGTTRERRKLKRFRRFLAAGEMSLHDVCQSYMSWRGHSRRHRDSGRTIYEMDRLFYSLFGAKPWKRKRR